MVNIPTFPPRTVVHRFMKQKFEPQLTKKRNVRRCKCSAGEDAAAPILSAGK